MTTSAAALAGCGRSGDVEAGTLRVGISNLPDSLDPARGQFASAALVYKQVHAGLTEYGPDGQLAPGLAERWEVTPDGLAWTFILREGLAWSDGRPLTAHDVAWSARRLVDPAHSFATLGDFQNVVNARAILAGEAPVESLGVEVVSDQAVRFNLESPLGLFPLLMREFYPFPRHIIERVGDDWITPANWVSAGAFTLASISQVQIGLRRNPHFYDATNVSIQTIRVEAVRDDATRARMFRAGELDLADNPPANQLDFLREQLGDGFQSFDAPILRYLKVNHARTPLDDALVRAELDNAIDREFLVRELFSGAASPTRSVLQLPQVAWSDETMERMRQSSDPGRSSMLSIDQLNRDPSPLIDRPLQIRTTTGLGERMAVALADDWRQIGVESEIFATYPTDLYQAVDAGDFDIAIASFNRGLKSDPFFMLDPFAPDGFAANFNWHDEHFAELMNRARRESDPIEHEEIYREANAHIQLEHAIITLVHDRAHWLVGERVSGTRADVQPQVWRYLELDDA